MEQIEVLVIARGEVPHKASGASIIYRVPVKVPAQAHLNSVNDNEQDDAEGK